jgi:hypothetical protein
MKVINDYGSNIVLGIDIETGEERKFLEYRTTKETTYRNFNIKIKSWCRKYGSYHSIKREAGSITTCDGGEKKYKVNVLNVIRKLEHGYVGVGFQYVDNLKIWRDNYAR